jgi:hypothetical protein
LDPFLINITGIHKTGIKGNMIADGFITPAGFRVAPGGFGGLPVAHPQGVVMSRFLKFTLRPAGRRKEEFPADILRRKVIDRRMAGLHHSLGLLGLGNGLFLKNHPHYPVGILYSGRPGVTPDRFFVSRRLSFHRSPIIALQWLGKVSMT